MVSKFFAPKPETYRRERFAITMAGPTAAVIMIVLMRAWDIPTRNAVIIGTLMATAGVLMAMSLLFEAKTKHGRSKLCDTASRLMIYGALVATTVLLFPKIDEVDVREFLLSLNLAAIFGSTIHSVMFPQSRKVLYIGTLATAGAFSVAIALDDHYLLALILTFCAAAGVGTAMYLNREQRALVDLDYQVKEARYRDHATSVLNRLGLASRLVDYTGSFPEQATLVLVNLDRFKSINDSFGHRAGDEVLRAAARRLQLAIPERSFLARVGGDEFAFVLPWPMDSKESKETFDTMLDVLSAPYPIARQGVTVSASIGAAPLESLDHFEMAMREADLAVIESKRVAGNSLSLFDGDRHLHEMRLGAIEQQFRTALINETIEFWAQPIFTLDTLLPTSIELLARWPDTDEQRISAGQFVKLAHQTGLVPELGNQALRRAGQVLREWEERPDLRHIGVNVNIAPIHLEQGLMRDIKNGVGPELLHRLQLELVESDASTIGTNNVTYMENLLRAGIGLTLDDFGAGTGSMTNLRLFPFTAVKVDQSFVRHIDKSYVNRGLVASVVQMARALELHIGLTGISSQAEFEMVRQLGPDSGQGYWLMPPMPVAMISEALGSYLQTIDGANQSLGERLQVLQSSWIERYQTITLSMREPDVARLIDTITAASTVVTTDDRSTSLGELSTQDAGNSPTGSAAICDAPKEREADEDAAAPDDDHGAVADDFAVAQASAGPVGVGFGERSGTEVVQGAEKGA